MINGCFLRLEKDNDRKTFFIFFNGCVRDMTKGLGKVMDGKEFNSVYHNLIKNGYVEI